MRKNFFVLMLIVLLVTGCGTSNGHDKFVIGIDDEFAPMGFHDEKGELVGFDIDLAREAAKRMGVTFEFKTIDWNRKREAITGGEVDIIWNGLDITDERKEYMIFTEPYMDDRQILLVRRGDYQNIYSEIDLEGKVVGLQSGSTAENYFHENRDLMSKFADFKTYGRFNDGLDALAMSKVDVFICDETVARYEMNRHPGQFDMINVKTGYVTEMGIGFRKSDAELRDRVQKVFDEMIDDGTAKKISEKWFQADLIKPHK